MKPACDARTPMVYLLHSGNLFGTERMALETLAALPEYRPVVVCPPGPLQTLTAERGIETLLCTSRLAWAGAIFRLFRRNRRLICLSTSLTQVLWIVLANLCFRRSLTHLHLVHGGADERDSYSRKYLLNRLPLVQVAVSGFVRERLIHYGVRPDRIQVVGNFLSAATLAAIPPHDHWGPPPRRRGVLVSRLVPDKRVDLLLEALARHPDLRSFSFDVFGTGGQLETLRQRAAESNLPVHFHGFAADVQQRLHAYDFLLHLNGREPFGMVLLEAMAAGIPVVVPDRGGPSEIVQDGHNGLTFAADDADALAAALRRLAALGLTELDQLLGHARTTLTQTYGQASQIARYREVIEAAPTRAQSP